MTDHTAFVQTLYAAFGRGDLQTILDNCTDDVEWGGNGNPEMVPWGGVRTGNAGATTFFTALLSNLDYEAFEPRKFFPAGDMIVVLGFAQARFKAGGRGMFASDWVHVFTIHEGKIARFHEYYDTAAIERAQAV